MNIVVRMATMADAAVLAGLYGALDYPSTVAEMQIRLGRVVTNENHGVLVAADMAGAVVGCVHIGRLMSLDADLSGQILGLVVAERVRRQGVGRALMAAAEVWARERKCTKVILRSSVRRTEAHAFYERIGYTNLKTQYAFGKDL
ncbi:MAG: GNAT family N-acetyltransferase [Opitutaceae bacterium]|nr:GNAT family N-acetyltransferase [Opitutaceae bacterium]